MSCGRIHARGRYWLSGWIVLMVVAAVVLALAPAPAQQKRTSTGETQWEEFQGCTLLTNATFDGDSFRVSYQNREYKFRLYFVDAPETDARFPDQVAKQAAYFGIAAADVPRAGQMATEFTRRWLGNRRFTVMMRWDNAGGQGARARFYGVVLLGKENLAKALVTHGWAWIHGTRANWPGGPGSAKFISELEKLEAVAREKKWGVWNDREYKRVAVTAKATAAGSTSRTTAGLVDLNTASKEALEGLPKIGPVLADRIIAGRPYRTVDDLEKVEGIGPKTMEVLRPLVTVSKR